MESNYDVIIVGAGLQGLVTARIFLELEPDLKLLILDSNGSIGGVWAKENLYPGLMTNNLRGTYEYTDFPMDDALGVKKEEHIPGEVIHEYFRRYAEKHNLTSRIEFGQKVMVAEKLQAGWRLEVETAWSKGQSLGPPPAQRTITCSKLLLLSVLRPPLFPSTSRVARNSPRQLSISVITLAKHPKYTKTNRSVTVCIFNVRISSLGSNIESIEMFSEQFPLDLSQNLGYPRLNQA